MEHLMYISTANPLVGGGDVFDIIQKSSSRNPGRGVTGFLIFAEGHFLQYVEGPSAALDGLLHDLAQDPRHHSIQVLDRRSCETRVFPGWKMKRVFVSDGATVFDDMLKPLRQGGVSPEALREAERLLTIKVA